VILRRAGGEEISQLRKPSRESRATLCGVCVRMVAFASSKKFEKKLKKKLSNVLAVH
jgi:hypothetical protein